MASLFAEIKRRRASHVVQSFAHMGIKPVKFYQGLSAIMGTDIWLFDAPVDTSIPPLATIAGVLFLEPDEEHNYAQQLWRDIYPFGTRSLAPPRLLPSPTTPKTSLPEILDLLQVPHLHDLGLTGKGTLIIVVDTGINGNRIPDALKAGGWTDDPGGDPWSDEVGHGTFCALIAHAVAPEAGIFSVKLRPGPNGGLMKESVLTAIDALVPFAAENPDIPIIMSNSWGTPACMESAEAYW